MTEATAISTAGLTKQYPGVAALTDLTLDVPSGSIYGFLGPNGAGKSTTMKMLTGFLPPSEGVARVAGFDVFEQPLEVKRRVGYLPETPPLYDAMTVGGYLRFVADLKGLPRARAAAEVDRAAGLAGCGGVLGRLAGNLSKGYRQRVGIAQALLGDPEVLVLDEPTVGLDPLQIREVRDLVRSLAGRHTVVLSTHVLPEVALTCQKVLVLQAGRLVGFDTLDGLVARHLPGRRVALDDVAFLEEIYARMLGAAPGPEGRA
jgi:ABC-2 type transport system ATP-binding protein